jgi:hypothetical protein
VEIRVSIEAIVEAIVEMRGGFLALRQKDL